MPPVDPTLIDAMPDPPSTTDTANFDPRADAFVDAFEPFVEQANQQAQDNFANATFAFEQAQGAMGFRDTTEGYRDEAEQFAATAVNAPGTSATIATALTIGSGIKAFTLVEPDKLFKDGMNLVAAVPGNSGNRVLGRLNNFDPVAKTGELHVIEAQGSGTFSNMVLSMAPINSLGDSITVTNALPIAAVEGDFLLINTAMDAAVVTMPANPDGRAPISVVRPSGSAGANTITLDRNGKTIKGVAENYVLDLPGYAVQLIWTGSTWGVLGPFIYNQ